MEREESIGNEATSKETVEDLEENESPEDDSDANLPSPDGAFDQPDGKKEADPI